MDGWNYYVGKKVFIILKNKRQYSGKVVSVERGEILTFIFIDDKYGNRISFCSDELDVMEEERE